MVSGDRPDKVLADVIRTGIETFRSAIDGVTSIIRQGDHTLRDLDSALTGSPAADSSNPEQAFLEIVSLVQATMLEAQQTGTANNPAVVQRAREILGRVSRAEPSWRPGPAIIRTVNDVIRMALRDLRGSETLLHLAQGTGTLQDLESLTQWADSLSDRVSKTQKMVAQPKPSITPSAPVSQEPVPAPSETVSQEPVLVPPPKPKKSKPKKKRDTTPQQKANSADVAFAQAVAEEIGDNKVLKWAKDFADGTISEKQWISRLTSHSASKRDSLDAIFERATKRLEKKGNEKKG